jgi:hypothetical protein
MRLLASARRASSDGSGPPSGAGIVRSSRIEPCGEAGLAGDPGSGSTAGRGSGGGAGEGAPRCAAIATMMACVEKRNG